MIKYDEQENCEIKIEKLSFDAFQKLDCSLEIKENICKLFWTENNENIQLFYVKPGKFHIIFFCGTLLLELFIYIKHRKLLFCKTQLQFPVQI